jgi:hypothetical protein
MKKRKATGFEALGLLRANDLTDEEAKILHEDISQLIEMCNNLNGEDAFGTEGWQHHLGWD